MSAVELYPTSAGHTREPILTVIVPVYNEAGTVSELLNRVVTAPYSKQVIVVDDGSTDGTSTTLMNWGQHPDILLLAHSRNRGKGAAIRTALNSARGQFTIIQDADLEYDPADYPHLVEPLVMGVAQIVYGSRYLVPHGNSRFGGLVFRLGVYVLNAVVRVLYGVRLTDEATCYKALATDLVRAMDLQCERFEFCSELTAKACRLRLRIHEVPIRYSGRSRFQGKKLRLRDGIAALHALWRWRAWEPSGTRIPSEGELQEHPQCLQQ